MRVRAQYGMRSCCASGGAGGDFRPDSLFPRTPSVASEGARGYIRKHLFLCANAHACTQAASICHVQALTFAPQRAYRDSNLSCMSRIPHPRTRMCTESVMRALTQAMIPHPRTRMYTASVMRALTHASLFHDSALTSALHLGCVDSCTHRVSHPRTHVCTSSLMRALTHAPYFTTERSHLYSISHEHSRMHLDFTTERSHLHSISDMWIHARTVFHTRAVSCALFLTRSH